MKFHENISTRCKIINILVFCKHVYKVKLAILDLNIHNFATSYDVLMKLRIQRAYIMAVNNEKIMEFS